MSSCAIQLAAAWLASTSVAQGAPVIEQVEPTSGAEGTTVNIVGRRFGADARVSIGVDPLPLISSRPNRLTVRIPQGTHSGNIAVSSAGATVRGPEFRVTPPLPAPAVDSFEPQKGPPGSHVVLRGKHFSALAGGNMVTLGGEPVVVLSAAPDQLELIVPEGKVGGPFVVRAGAAGEAASKASFEITARTAITAVEPPRGGPGSEVTLRGTGFSSVPKQNRVYLNNLPLAVKSASETTLVVTLPMKTVSGQLLVDVEGAGRAYAAQPFVVQHPPIVLDFRPKQGPPGTVLTVRGTNFGRNAEAVEAKIGDVALAAREAHDTVLTLQVPEGVQDGKLSVRIQGVGPAWSAQPFRVLLPLRLTGFTPKSGALGTEVTISGEGFPQSVSLVRASVGGASAHVLSVSPTQLKLRILNGRGGPIEIAVSGKGEARTSEAFTVLEAAGSAAPAAVPAPKQAPAAPAGSPRPEAKTR
ncbi:MAG: IPT/TIG domain-containing protein [Polyangiales bacterium]